MKKKFLPILLLSVLLLVSCGEAVDVAATDTAAVEPETEVEDQAATAEEGETAEEAAESETGEENTETDTEAPFTDADNPCMPFSVLNMSLTTPYPDLPPVTDADYVIGPDDAILTFIEYSEPQCPYCAQLEPLLTAFQAMYPEDVRLVFRFRPFPESFHDKSYIASQAMVAAGKQAKFNEFKNFLFERQYQDTGDTEQAAMSEEEFWGSMDPANFDAWLKERVGDLGINYTQLLEDMYAEDVVAQVKTWADEATALGFTGTPYLLINGYQWPESSRGIEVFTIYLRLLKNQAVELDTCPPTVIDETKSYSATISTTKGDIKVDLFPDKAPLAVNNFVYLAQQGWYDDLSILSSEEFILSGDPSDTGYGGAGYAFMDETNDLTFDEPGMLSVYSLWPGYGYNGSMFFINKTALTDQNNRVIFGKVTEGMDVVEAITLRSNIFESVQDMVLKITITES